MRPFKTHLQPRPTQLTADADGAPGVDGLHDLIAGWLGERGLAPVVQRLSTWATHGCWSLDWVSVNTVIGLEL